MVNRRAPALILRLGDREKLGRMTRSQSMSAGMVRRARIVLLASEGRRNAEIAELAGASRPKANLWRSRYEERGIAGLVDEKRSGQPRTIDHAQIVTATLMPPPKALGVIHWSSRLLAASPLHLVMDNYAAHKHSNVKAWLADNPRFTV